MRCHEAESFLLAAPDGGLTESQRAELAAHIAGCAGCRRLEANLSVALATYRAEAAAEPLPDADKEWRRLQTRLASEAGRTGASRRRRPPASLFWIGGPLAAAAAVALALWIGRPAGLPSAAPDQGFEPSPLAGLAQADFVEVAAQAATPIVFVDQASGWLVVWADTGAEDAAG